MVSVTINLFCLKIGNSKLVTTEKKTQLYNKANCEEINTHPPNYFSIFDTHFDYRVINESRKLFSSKLTEPLNIFTPYVDMNTGTSNPCFARTYGWMYDKQKLLFRASKKIHK